MRHEPSYLALAQEAALAGGKVLMKHFGTLAPDEIVKKGANDFVSRVDTESEAAIRRVILEACPSHEFLGEEGGAVGALSEWRWLVDPLDGTSNYVSGLAQFSVSIALHDHGSPVVAVVYDPVRDITYQAERGAGARCNGEPMSVASARGMADSLIGTGFPFRHHEVLAEYVETFQRVFTSSAGVRRMGSAALDLAYVACGATGGFWEFLLSPWDVAAGALLVEEAGGVVTDTEGGQNYLESGNIVAGAPAVHEALLSAINPARSEPPG